MAKQTNAPKDKKARLEFLKGKCLDSSGKARDTAKPEELEEMYRLMDETSSAEEKPSDAPEEIPGPSEPMPDANPLEGRLEKAMYLIKDLQHRVTVLEETVVRMDPQSGLTVPDGARVERIPKEVVLNVGGRAVTKYA